MEYNGKYVFDGYDNQHSVCWLKVNRKNNIVLVTELADNQGTPVANINEILATRVCKEFGLNPYELTWIEHTGKQTYKSEQLYQMLSGGKDQYFLVHFNREEYIQSVGLSEDMEVLSVKTWRFVRMESVEIPERDVPVFLQRI